DRVDVEAALTVELLPELEEVEYALDVRVEAVLALARERAVAALQDCDGGRGVGVEVGLLPHAVLRQVVAVLVDVVERRRDPLVVGGDDPRPEGDAPPRAAIAHT